MITRRVGLIGHGAIGGVLAASLVGGEVPGAELVGVCAHHPLGDLPVEPMSVDALIDRCDLVVEAAGHEAVHDHAVDILTAGCDLVLVSVGALADEDLLHRIREAGPGRLVICTGAVGGIDLLRAAARMRGLTEVRLTTTKHPRAFGGTDHAPRMVFEGSARDAATAFPKSINVAATLALAVGSWELVTVRIVSDPAASRTGHVIDAVGDAGSYRFEIANRPSDTNPATSAVVPHAVLRTIADLATESLTFR